MRAFEIIGQVDDLRPNAFSLEQKLQWLRRMDGQIRAEMLDTHFGQLPPADAEPRERDRAPEELPPCLQEGEGARLSLPEPYEPDTELLAPFPFGEMLYTAVLFCQIDLHNGEIQRYNQSLSLLAAAWRSFADWLNRTYMPRGVGGWKM